MSERDIPAEAEKAARKMRRAGTFSSWVKKYTPVDPIMEVPEKIGQGRVFGYVRASTSKQVDSPHIQKGIIEKYAMTHILKPIDLTFGDEATSGKSALHERKAGNVMIRSMRKGDVIIVAHLDRLSRSWLDFARTLDTIEKRGVILHVCDMPGGVFDPSNHISRLLMHIIISFAEYERSMKAQRIEESRSKLKEDGRRWCNEPPYGYTYENRWQPSIQRNKKFLVQNDYEVAIMMKCVEMKSQGYSLPEIAKHLTEWGVFKRPRITKGMRCENGPVRGVRSNKWNVTNVISTLNAGVAFLKKTHMGQPDYATQAQPVIEEETDECPSQEP